MSAGDVPTVRSELLSWVAERLVTTYGESAGAPEIIRLREMAAEMKDIEASAARRFEESLNRLGTLDEIACPLCMDGRYVPPGPRVRANCQHCGKLCWVGFVGSV
jgi:hypothetical protein